MTLLPFDTATRFPKPVSKNLDPACEAKFSGVPAPESEVQNWSWAHDIDDTVLLDDSRLPRIISSGEGGKISGQVTPSQWPWLVDEAAIELLDDSRIPQIIKSGETSPLGRSCGLSQNDLVALEQATVTGRIGPAVEFHVCKDGRITMFSE